MGAAIQLVLLSAVVAGLLGWRCHALGYPPLRVRLERKPVVYLGSFGLMSVASGFAQGLSDASVRGALIACAGATANGLLQAPYVLAITVRGVILASIGSVSLATIAPQTDRGEISRAVDRLLNVVLPLGVTALGLLGLLGAYAMTLLYSHAFAAGAAFLPYMLAADLLLVFIWVIGAPVLAAGDRVLWLLLDLLFAATRWGVAILLMRRMDSLAVVLGILAGVALHCALNLAVYRFRYRLELSAKHLIRLLLGIGFVAALSLAGAGTVRPAVTGVAFVAWGGYVVYHSRKNGIFAALQQRVRRDGAHETGAPGFPPAG
jgi:O-antigen/teichoic acid export membrane protein